MKNLLAKAATATAVVFIASTASAQDVAWTLVNNTSMAVMEFYTTPVTDGAWGPDLLGSDVVESGGRGTVTIADGSSLCDYDVMFVFDDGSEMTDRVDVCAMSTYTLQ